MKNSVRNQSNADAGGAASASVADDVVRSISNQLFSTTSFCFSARFSRIRHSSILYGNCGHISTDHGNGKSENILRNGCMCAMCACVYAVK